MDTINLSSILGATDIYLIDGIVKGRYGRENVLLDAGCGGGRNLYWFLQNGFSIYGIDQSAEAIEALKEKYPDLPEKDFVWRHWSKHRLKMPFLIVLFVVQYCILPLIQPIFLR
jgi:SAM-dependent methyltransferase